MKLTKTERYQIAYHEAAHCLMSVWRDCIPVAIDLDECAEDNRLGRCVITPPKHWQDEVWICLAGPIAELIEADQPTDLLFYGAGGSDLDEALQAICRLVLPGIPAELVEVIGNDPFQYMLKHKSGWQPEVRGQAKRKLTLYTKQLIRAYAFAWEMLEREVGSVEQFLLRNSWFLEIVKHIAEELLARQTMKATEITEVITASIEHTKMGLAA